jgi:hypothetical protein
MSNYNYTAEEKEEIKRAFKRGEPVWWKHKSHKRWSCAVNPHNSLSFVWDSCFYSLTDPNKKPTEEEDIYCYDLEVIKKAYAADNHLPVEIKWQTTGWGMHSSPDFTYKRDYPTYRVKKEDLKKVLDRLKEEHEENEWIEWEGGECPISLKTRVYVRYRSRITCQIARPAYDYFWEHEGIDSDIIAYKVIQKEGGKHSEIKLGDVGVKFVTQGVDDYSKYDYFLTNYDIEDNQQQENEPMSTTTIKSIKSFKVEQVTYIVGCDGVRKETEECSNEDVFNYIFLLEQEIEKLSEIKRKPKALQAEIDRINSEITALVELVDKRVEAK